MSSLPSLIIGRSSLVIPRRKRGGFALLITITLLAFLVLLLVSLASLTRVETQVASNNQSLAQARQNALMALNIALGQLQKYTGPDQRVTAAADLAAAADGTRLAGGALAQNTSAVNGTLNGLAPASATASVQSGTRWWTGVWARAGTSYATAAKSIYEETPSPVLLNWLVSGNEGASFTVDSSGLVQTSSVDGRTAAAAAPFTPGAPVNWAAAGLDTSNPSGWSGGYSNLEIKSSGQKAVLLVGPRTAGVAADSSGAPAVDRYVVAPMKDITTPSSNVPGAGTAGTATVGRYAWWVGDEGVKASYALADPHAGQTDPSSSADARLRLMSASRTGLELVSGWQDYPAVNDLAAETKLSRVLQMQQAPLLTPSLSSQDQKKGIHDFTSLSRGLLTDTLNGGLRQDLTYHFESASNWNASSLKGRGIIPATWSPNWGTSAAPDYAPKWDWLQSFYNTNPDAASSLVVRPETSTEVGVFPVITQLRMIVFTDPDEPVDSVDVGNIRVPAGNYSIPMRCNVAFVLANPYNVTLNVPANTYEFTIKNTYTGTNPPMPSNPQTVPPGLVIFASDINHSLSASYGTFVFMRDPADSVNRSMLDQVRFVIPAVSIPPGGNCVLSVDGSSQVAGAGFTTAPAPGAEDRVDLAVNTISNTIISAIGGTGDYFTAKTSLNFTAPAPVAPATTTRVLVNFTVNEMVALTTTLRRTSDQAVLQQLTDCGFSKKGLVALGSHEDNIIGNFHTTFLPPAWRDMDSSTAAAKFYNALLSYARPYQDLNLRAAIIDHTAVDTTALWTPVSYGGGSARSGVMSLSGNFTQDLSPATWAENFGTGTTTSPDGGATRAPVASRGVLFDFPRRTAAHPPVLSIGGLQHANLTADDWHPGHTINSQSGYAVGNSYSAPFVTRGASVQSRAKTWYKAPSSPARFFDLAYLLNTALWDGYFFSGIPQSGSAFKPLNPRYALDESVDDPAEARSADSAEHLSVKGAFNINSTSKEAWIAVLGGLNGLRVNDDSETAGVPYPRTLWQPEHSQSSAGGFQTSGTGDDAYAGYRRLTSAEIDKLAAEIVKRVRARGPFVSLSHFINRSLVAASGAFNASINDADTSGNLAAAAVPMGRGLSGPLQAAIDSSAAGINTYVSTGSGGFVTAAGAGAYGDRALFAGEILSTSTQKPALTNTGPVYFADKLVDLPHLDPVYANSASPGPQGRTSTGIPGWLLQGDLLQALGPALSARSDTFVIRTYGEVVNPASPSEVQARAWCEAVVQRITDYVDPTADSAHIAPAGLTSQDNKTFGRLFKVTSFRWLSPEDI